MIFIENLFRTFKNTGVNFFTGVPDSILKNFSLYLDHLIKKNHVLTTNEGSAVSVGIGYHLSTKKIPCVYLQNSGLSNAINPLISIADKKVYSIPLVLMIGWRGAPGTTDEPQHEVKGKITIKLLKLLKIDFCELKNERDLLKLKKIIISAKKNNKIVACLIRKDTFQLKKKIKRIQSNNNSILRSKFIYSFLNLIPKKSRIISTTGYTSRELMVVRKKFNIKKGKDFYMVGGMGHSSSVALGYSINKKEHVYCLDGDGSILMHLGSLRTIGFFNNKNFKHILLNNNSHESVGGQSTTAEGIDFKKLSNSLGYKKYYKILNKANVDIILKKFIKSNGPSLLEVKIKNGSIDNLLRPKNLIKIKKNFMVN